MNKMHGFMKSVGVNFNLVIKLVGLKLEPISKKVNDLFNASKKDIEIFHLGGTKNPTFDPENRGSKLDAKGYFYERVPVKTKDGEIHTYGKELKKYVEEWMKEVRAEKTEENFQTWMENKSKNVEIESKIKAHSVRCFNDIEREQTEIHVDGSGSLLQIGLDSEEGALKTLKDGEYIFVVGEFFNDTTERTETRFYATPKVKTEKGKIQHSSFLRGGNVRSAGVLVVNDGGQIINIRNQSGHYKPSQREMAYLLKHLKESGFDISKIHVTCSRHQFFNFVSSFLKIDIKWGIVKQNAEKWFESTGKDLIR